MLVLTLLLLALLMIYCYASPGAGSKAVVIKYMHFTIWWKVCIAARNENISGGYQSKYTVKGVKGPKKKTA